jgi:biopolymer transport protein ExbD
MGLKKRSKVSATFNMSSLTDIIFLLLIFFMLTSNLVSPNALNLKLPGKGNPTTVSSKIPDVSITTSGTFYLNGRRISIGNLERALRRLSVSRTRQLNMTISPAQGVPVEHVVAVMDVAMRLGINAILATPK